MCARSSSSHPYASITWLECLHARWRNSGQHLLQGVLAVSSPRNSGVPKRVRFGTRPSTQTPLLRMNMLLCALLVCPALACYCFAAASRYRWLRRRPCAAPRGVGALRGAGGPYGGIARSTPVDNTEQNADKLGPVVTQLQAKSTTRLGAAACLKCHSLRHT